MRISHSFPITAITGLLRAMVRDSRIALIISIIALVIAVMGLFK